MTREDSAPDGQATSEERQDPAGQGAAATSRASHLARVLELASSSAGLLVVLVVGILVGSRCGVGTPAVVPGAADSGAAEAAEAAQIWICSMHPQIRMQESGACPICGMDLIPAPSSDHGGGSSHERDHKHKHNHNNNNNNNNNNEDPGRVVLSPRARALAQVRTEPVLRTEARAEVRLLGRVDHDESRLRTVTSWTAGRIDRLTVRTTGTRIGKNRVVAKLYSPEIYTATRELALAGEQAAKLRGAGATGLGASTLEASRTRLRLLGVTESVIDEIERTGEAPRTVDIRSPYGGTVLERHVEEGQYVSAGAPFFSIADLSEVWVQIDAYESDLPYLKVGQEVELTVEAVPGEVFVGKVGFIDPVLDKTSRTARVRVEVANREGQLSPGMFASAVILAGTDNAQSQLVVASSAPLFTGRRSVVYVEVPEQARPTFELREIRVGPKSGPVYPVLSGLREGERVVTHGAFLLDADLQLAGGRSMMTLADDRAQEVAPALAVTPAFLESVSPVMGAYLDAQERFVEDDLAGAKVALDQLAVAVNELEPPGSRAVREAWQGTASTLSGHARHAANAETIGESRNALEQISLELEDFLERFGNPTGEVLRIAFCPMAFDSRGARWIQRDQALQNPYYGEAMLRCGEFRASVSPGERAPARTPAEVDPDHGASPSTPAEHRR